jgi:hypothetical protein
LDGYLHHTAHLPSNHPYIKRHAEAITEEAQEALSKLDDPISNAQAAGFFSFSFSTLNFLFFPSSWQLQGRSLFFVPQRQGVPPRARARHKARSAGCVLLYHLKHQHMVRHLVDRVC